MFLIAMLNLKSVTRLTTLLLAAVLHLWSANEFIVKESPGATGLLDFTVINNRDVPLTGFTVKAVYYPAGVPNVATWIYDSAANGESNQPALKPGESYTWHLTPKNPTDLRPADFSVDAAIFADGLAVGDAAAIQSLWKRRKWAAIGLQQVFKDLDSVPDVENTQDTISLLKRSEEQQLPPGTPREKRHGISNAYETIIGGL